MAITTPLAAGQCDNPMVHQPLLNLLPDGAATVVAVQDGPWSAPATWGGTLPADGDRVLIPTSRSVVFDLTKSPRLHQVRVDGVLSWATDQDTMLRTDTLYSTPSGSILVGTEETPILAPFQADFLFIADVALDHDADPGQLGRGLIAHGPLSMVGADITDHALLVGDAPAGATSFELREPPVGWRVDDLLVLGGTFYDPDGSDADDSRFHDEVVRITAIDGATISFVAVDSDDGGLRWDHVRPDGVTFDADELALVVANLTRTIQLRSELDPASPDLPGPSSLQDMRRAHLMVMHTNEVAIRNVAVRDFGRSNKEFHVDDVGQNVDGSAGTGTNIRGRYGLHLHRNLPPANAPIDLDACPPAMVTGCVVWGSPGWGFVHHDSYAVFEDNVAFDVLGTAFAQEAGNEIGAWRRNVSIKTTGDSNPAIEFDGSPRTVLFDFGFNGESYWIQGAGQVVFEDNIAISANNAGVDHFASVDAINMDRANIPREHVAEAFQDLVADDSGLISVALIPPSPIRRFTVYNASHAFISWNHKRNNLSNGQDGFNPAPSGGVLTNHAGRSLVEDLQAWNIYENGVFMQYSTMTDFRNCLFAGSGVSGAFPTLRRSGNGDGSGYGLAMNGPSRRHLFEDIRVEGFTRGIGLTHDGGEFDPDPDGRPTPVLRSTLRRVTFAGNILNASTRLTWGNNNYKAFPRYLVLDDVTFLADLEGADESPIASFEATPVGPDGVVRVDGRSSVDPDAARPTEIYDHGIIAYAWDFDGDGQPDRHGQDATWRYADSGTQSITLTVWDQHGTASSLTQTVDVVAAAYGELLTGGDFGSDTVFDDTWRWVASQYGPTWLLDREASVSTSVGDGGAVILQGGGEARLGQVVFDDGGHVGLHRLRARVLNQADASGGNTVRLQVFGNHGGEVAGVSGGSPEPVGLIPVTIDTLLDETIALPASDDWVAIERSVDLGDGYQFIFVRIAADADNGSNGDFMAVDDVSLRGITTCSADVDGDGLVGLADQVWILANWGSGAGDLDGDGTTGLTDLLIVLAQWGSCG